jgi:NAD(P)-dependent dehydrogenase (short-subunit alcohol dehydrogenase family)
MRACTSSHRSPRSRNQFHQQFNTNVLGLLLATQEAAKLFGTEGGSVINIGSTASRITPPTSVVYTATKGAVDAITHVLANSDRLNYRAPHITLPNESEPLARPASTWKAEVAHT